MASVSAINNLGGYAHNPRGNLWFNDESTYGHKLLAKMGWNKGKGLGKNEDGIKENLKVKFRNTNSGLGFKNDAHTDVMKTEYESILKNLSAVYSNSGTRNQNKNVEDSEENSCHKTKVVKSKLRYPKLFFGKDVTKYSEKDMKSIFICSTPLKSLEDKSENLVNLDKSDPKSESSQTLQTYSSSLSISDYFAKKMEEKKGNTANKHFCKNTINHETSLASKNIKSEESNDIDKPNEAITETHCLMVENSVLSNKNSSKKRKKKPEINSEDIKINSKDAYLCASNITEKVCDNSLHKSIDLNDFCENENFSKPNKKRKLSEAFKNNSVESTEIAYPSETKSSSLPKTKKKKNKNKKDSTMDRSTSVNDNKPVDVNGSTSNHFFLEPVVNGVSKKQKKSKKKLKENFKSCLKKKCDSYSFKNVSFNETVSYRIIDSDIESVDPLAFNENLDENIESCKLTDIDQNNSDNNTNSEEQLRFIEQNSDNDISEKDQVKLSEESDKEYTSSDLPSSKSSHYNAWVESQRLALKMELYKKMLKSIKKHKILKTTNLLSIKGYGNWGFK